MRGACPRHPSIQKIYSITADDVSPYFSASPSLFLFLQLLGKLQAKPELLLKLKKTYVTRKKGLASSGEESSALFDEASKIIGDLTAALAAQRPEVYASADATRPLPPPSVADPLTSGLALFTALREPEKLLSCHHWHAHHDVRPKRLPQSAKDP